MNTTPSPLTSYGPAGFVLIILQWVLVAGFKVTMPDDVALAAAGLLGHIIDTLRQTNLIQGWFTRPRAAAPVTIPAAAVQLMQEANDALTGMAGRTEVRTSMPVDAWRPPAPPPAPEPFDPTTHWSRPAPAAAPREFPTIADIPGLTSSPLQTESQKP